MAWKQDASQHQWDNLSVYSFPLFSLHSQVLLKVLLSTNASMILVAPLWPQKEWFVDLLALPMEEPLELSMLWNLLIQPHTRKFHRGLESLHLHIWRLKLLVHEARFSIVVADVVASDLRRFTACLYQGNFSIGVVDEILIHARLLFHRKMDFYMFVFRELKLSVLV